MTTPADVHVNRADILELLDVFAEIDENDGDGRHNWPPSETYGND